MSYAAVAMVGGPVPLDAIEVVDKVPVERIRQPVRQGVMALIGVLLLVVPMGIRRQ